MPKYRNIDTRSASHGFTVPRTAAAPEEEEEEADEAAGDEEEESERADCSLNSRMCSFSSSMSFDSTSRKNGRQCSISLPCHECEASKIKECEQECVSENELTWSAHTLAACPAALAQSPVKTNKKTDMKQSSRGGKQRWRTGLAREAKKQEREDDAEEEEERTTRDHASV